MSQVCVGTAGARRDKGNVLSDAPKPDAEPSTWAALRDAAATAHLAVQMLAGPLAPWNEPGPDVQRVRDAMRTLEAATRRLNGLIAALRPEPVARTHGDMRMVAQPGAARAGGDAGSEVIENDARAPAPFVRPPFVRPPLVPAPTTAAQPADVPPRVAASAGAIVRIPEVAAAPRSPARPGRERRKAAAVVAPPPTPSVEVGALLRAVEIELLTQGHSVSIHAKAGLWVAGDLDDLVAPIVALVLDAAALGPTDARVELRAFTDLACALGDDVDVVFEVRPDVRVPPGRTFRPGAAALPEGVRIELGGAGCRPRACLRAAASAPARILAA